VVGVHDELTGQAVNSFVSLKAGNEHNEQVRKDLVLQVRKSIGPFAAPKVCFHSASCMPTSASAFSNLCACDADIEACGRSD
jgi:acyl-coenzyme A synthetase/AMP-(fatty) acid ligase